MYKQPAVHAHGHQRFTGGGRGGSAAGPTRSRRRTHGRTLTTKTLGNWLRRIEGLHPREIELGLERIGVVQRRMELHRPAFGIITVAGTNGKGSVVALLEAMLGQAGYRVGAYTSPHLVHYNERVRLIGEDVSDDQLCRAFERVEMARSDVPLTYFEFGTLAAVDVFVEANMDIAVLEAGLGGRLDAVNVFDADVAVVTAVGLDHTEWLGSDREAIGREKAGIFRRGRPAVCSDPAPPAAIARAARETGATLYQLNQDFFIECDPSSCRWRGPGNAYGGLPVPIPSGVHQQRNLAAAIMALTTLESRFPLDPAAIHQGVLEAVLPGRLQMLPGRPLIILDVAHNPQAVEILAATLGQPPFPGKTLAVVGMFKDKAAAKMLRLVASLVDHWYFASLDPPRGATADDLRSALRQVSGNATTTVCADVEEAFVAAKATALENDRIVVFGSFQTVGAIMRRQLSKVS